MRQENLKLKEIKDQVIVITGASSGIGLATAKMAAARGARVVLASRNAEVLEEIVGDIRKEGGQAIAATCDVSKVKDVKKLADRAIHAFGTIDTWVNNAGVSIWGPALKISAKEAHKLFQTNFWGVHYGCKVAVPILAKKGGAIINIGSEVSERASVLQAMYSASKHAVKAYTDCLRMEVEQNEMPISLTLIRPAAVDTPFTEHAVNHLENGTPSLPPPIYNPDIVANAILECAMYPKRDLFVGGASKVVSVLESISPRLVDYYMELQGEKNFAAGTDAGHPKELEGLMHAPSVEGEIRGQHRPHVRNSSLWTTASLGLGRVRPEISRLTKAASGANYNVTLSAGISMLLLGLAAYLLRSRSERDQDYEGTDGLDQDLISVHDEFINHSVAATRPSSEQAIRPPIH